MPPPGMPPGIAGVFSGFSATTASVVRKRAAIEAALRGDLQPADHTDGPGPTHEAFHREQR